MKILVNLLRFDPDVNIGGNYSYSYNILKELVKINNNQYILLVTSRNKSMFKFDCSNVKYVINKLSKYIAIRIIEENLIIKKNTISDVADVYFSPVTLLPFFSINIPSVSTIHDLNFKHFSQGKLKDIYKNLLYKHTIKKCTYITTVSEFTKKDVMKNYKIDESRIGVVYNACNFSIKDIDDEHAKVVRNKYNINNNYILVISHYKHKNAQLAIKAFSLAKKNLKEKYKLVILGARNDLLNELKKLSVEIGVSEDIVFIPYAEKDDMAYMYYNAKLFLFPSLFEGFGIPPLEAMKVGCPVISSDCEALLEVLGNKLNVISVNDLEAWVREIVRVLNNEEYRNELINSGFHRVKKFSWEKSANSLNTIFKSVVQ